MKYIDADKIKAEIERLRHEWPPTFTEGEKQHLHYYFHGLNKVLRFAENAWIFLKKVLNSGTMNICDSISYMYAWADHLGIDLDTHIKWKMKYNELRPYKHGGKKY